MTDQESRPPEVTQIYVSEDDNHQVRHVAFHHPDNVLLKSLAGPRPHAGGRSRDAGNQTGEWKAYVNSEGYQWYYNQNTGHWFYPEHLPRRWAVQGAPWQIMGHLCDKSAEAPVAEAPVP